MSFSLQLLLIFLLAAVLTAAWWRLALYHRWLVPPNARSSHELPVPSGGGVGFVVALLLYLVCTGEDVLSGWEGTMALVGAAILALTGLVDDFSNLGIRLRFGLQIMVIALLWPFLMQMPPLSISGMVIGGAVLAAFLAVGMLWHINLYNFMDGIDALAAMQAIFLCSSLPMLVSPPLHAAGSAMLILGAAVCGFLLFNLPRARLFMGDAGSYFLGYLLPLLALAQVADERVSIWVVLILAGGFIVDSTTTLLGRFSQGAVWYHPHRTHAYQLLAVRWSGHGSVVAVYAVVNVFWLLPLAWWAVRQPQLGALLTLVAWTPLTLLVLWVRRRHAGASADI